MKIRGAVLHRSGEQRPYGTSRPLTIEQLDLADPGPTEVLVRIEVAGLCHSDLSVVDGNRPRPLPMLLGHESAGIVELVGSDVKDIAIGQRVTMTFLPRCGECRACRTNGRIPCERGSEANSRGELLGGGSRLSIGGQSIRHHLGVSAFADHAVVDRRSIIPVDNDVPADVAALLGCAVLTGGGAVLNAGRPNPGSTVAVVGLGGVGMAALLTALSEPDIQVIAVDTSPEKLVTALTLGANQAMSPAAAVDAQLRADVVIEAAGAVPAFEAALSITDVGGTTVTVGLPPAHTMAKVSPLGLVSEGRWIVGSYLGSAVPTRDIPRFVERWRDGNLPVEKLISGVSELGDVNSALDALAEGKAMRQLLRMDHG